MCFLMFDKKRKKSVYLTAFLRDYDTTLSFSVLLAPNHLSGKGAVCPRSSRTGPALQRLGDSPSSHHSYIWYWVINIQIRDIQLYWMAAFYLGSRLLECNPSTDRRPAEISNKNETIDPWGLILIIRSPERMKVMKKRNPAKRILK